MKKIMLFTFGVGDSFFDKRSFRCIKRSDEILNKLTQALKDPNKDFFGIVRFNEPSDQFDTIDISSFLPQGRTIDVKLCSNNGKTDAFSCNNQISMQDTSAPSSTAEEVILDGNHLDHILPPSQYEIHIAGIDINAVFIPLIDKLKDMGYDTVVYSDSIKPYNKKTIEHIRNSKILFRKS